MPMRVTVVDVTDVRRPAVSMETQFRITTNGTSICVPYPRHILPVRTYREAEPDPINIARAEDYINLVETGAQSLYFTLSDYTITIEEVS